MEQSNARSFFFKGVLAFEGGISLYRVGILFWCFGFCKLGYSHEIFLLVAYLINRREIEFFFAFFDDAGYFFATHHLFYNWRERLLV